MPVLAKAGNPAVLSYRALRRMVGCIAVGLPVVLLLSSLILRGVPGMPPHGLPPSISAYYYTPMRNVIVGSLCAIAFFNVCARGYDWRDEIAGIISAISAMGMVFFPTWPPAWIPSRGDGLPSWVNEAHHVFAEFFFGTLAIMCLFLFRSTAINRPLTRAKRRRNAVYLACGYVMVVCGITDFLCHQIQPIPQWGPVGSIFCCEFVALEAFGVAWLVKGKTFRKGNHRPHPPQPQKDRQMAEA